jgi:hypothetical protein
MQSRYLLIAYHAFAFSIHPYYHIMMIYRSSCRIHIRDPLSNYSPINRVMIIPRLHRHVTVMDHFYPLLIVVRHLGCFVVSVLLG